MKSSEGFTWVETLVALCVTSFLLVLGWKALETTIMRGCGSSIELSSMKQLHLATQSMALDGTTEHFTNASWPGDTDGSFTNWASRIVPDYLGTNDFCKLISLYSRAAPQRSIPTANTNAILVYQVREKHDGSFVFLTTANFTNTPTGGAPPLSGSKRLGNNGFAVFRKGGDGAILLAKQAGNTNLVGSFAPLCK